VDQDRGRADQAIDRRLDSVNVPDIVEWDLIDAVARDANQTEVGQQVPLAGDARREAPRTAAPQQPFPWQRDLGMHGNLLTTAACRS
jgi:hypothetical protein